LNPAINQTIIMHRIARKVMKAAERIGFMPAIGTQAVVRCNGRVQFKDARDWPSVTEVISKAVN
jgi:hypothetical protein